MNASSPMPSRERRRPTFAWGSTFLSALLLSAVGGAAIVTLSLIRYQASTLLLVRRPPEKVDPLLDESVDLATQLALVKSPPVLTDVIADPEISGLPTFQDVDDKVGFLQQHVRAAPIGDSAILQISMASPFQDDVHKIVNRVREAYLSLFNSENHRTIENTLASLQAEKERRFKDLEVERENLARLARQQNARLEEPVNGISIPPSRDGRLSAIPIEALGTQLANTEISVLMLEARKQAQLESFKTQPPVVDKKAVDQAVGIEPRILELAAAVEESKELLNARRDGMSAAMREKLTEEIAKRTQEWELAKEQRRPQIEQSLRQDLEQTRAAAIRELDQELETQKRSADAVRSRLRTLLQELSYGEPPDLAFQFKQQDLQRKEAILDKINDRIEQLKLEAGRRSAVTILSAAERPIRPVSPFPMLRDRVIPIMIGLFLLPWVVVGLGSALASRAVKMADANPSNSGTLE